ncbi:serine/threonine protein kinase [Pseudosporangium ferrugineum]|uniref:non-specific serine/threonine protein kinase n=2 Tax=Pseudosporangium ferrugineum TaxID=439699 RepID=A0A2T0SHR3_9ACTN|nr:serine/threonine protein kinase [Pseudosporangium ferrugineum]
MAAPGISARMTAGPVGVAGRYRLGESLGAGGMGQVWVARDEVLGREVAVKEIVLPEDLVAGERDSVHRRMLQEARAAARLSHPNVAQVYDVFEDEGRAWIVMEYVASRSLQEVIHDDGPLTPVRAAEIGLELVAALEAAHRKGVRHRDVKPANVLLGHDGRVVLTDFGIASIDGDSVITTTSEVVLGSPQYMSPERATDGTAEASSDLWSLGATLYAAVEGRSPFARPSAMGTLTALAADEPDPAVRAGALQPVLDGLLRKDPAERIDIAETRRRLRAVLAGSAPPPRDEPAPEPAAGPTGPTVPTAAGPTDPAGPTDLTGPRRRRRLVLLASVIVAVLVAGALIFRLATRTGPGSGTRAQEPPATTATTAPAAPAPVPSAPGSSPANAGPGRATAKPPAKTTVRNTGRVLPPRPSGWRDYRDPTGFALYVPEGWNRSRDGSIVYFRNPRGGGTLGIDQTDEPKWDPVADWRGKRDHRVGAGEFPGYKEIHIREVSYFRKAADWEYTFNGSNTRQHVNNRGVVTSAHQAYGIYWQTPDRAWAAARKDLQLIFDSFRPAT